MKRPYSKATTDMANEIARSITNNGTNKRRRYTKKFIPGKTRTSGYYGRYNTTKNSELKFFDTQLAFSFDLTGEVPATGQLNLIPQGVTESQRVGRKCVVKSIHIRGYCLGASDQPSDIIRLMVVLDRQCNGAAAVGTDILTTANTYSFNNLANSQRFLILKDWYLQYNVMASVGNAATFPNQVIKVKWNKKCNIPLEFSSTTGAITEIRSNNIFLYAAGLNDDKTTFVGNCRIRFSDG